MMLHLILLRNNAEGVFYLATFIFIYYLSHVGFCVPSHRLNRSFLLRNNTFIESESVNMLMYICVLLIVTFLSLRQFDGNVVTNQMCHFERTKRTR